MDENKDQSYFLWTLTQKQLARCLFPIGKYTKTGVRAIARQAGLSTADKPDSQGICFIGEVPIVDFLKARIPDRVGAVVTGDGRKIGEHDGAVFYTIGQRHGLKLSSRLPYYVAKKDVSHNIITVAEGNSDPILYQDDISIFDISWVDTPPVLGEKLSAKIRYRQKSEPLTVTACNQIIDNHSHILKDERVIFSFKFDRPQRAITSGQSLVLYRKDRVVGGGIIL